MLSAAQLDILRAVLRELPRNPENSAWYVVDVLGLCGEPPVQTGGYWSTDPTTGEPTYNFGVIESQPCDFWYLLRYFGYPVNWGMPGWHPSGGGGGGGGSPGTVTGPPCLAGVGPLAPGQSYCAANNGQDCDNACQLAKAINKTGVQSLNNPCTVVGWYAASALAAGGGLAVANARQIGTAAAENYPTLLHRFLTWLIGSQPRPGTLGAAIALAKAAPGQIKDACSALQ